MGVVKFISEGVSEGDVDGLSEGVLYGDHEVASECVSDTL